MFMKACPETKHLPFLSQRIKLKPNVSLKLSYGIKKVKILTLKPKAELEMKFIYL